MITQVIYLEDYDWLIKIYYAVSTYYTDEILEELDSIGCEGKAFESIKSMLINHTYNSGYTYSNQNLHVTIMVIGLTDSAEEFQNTFDHEKGHAATHIAEYYDINPYGEEFQYLQGKIGQEMFKEAKKFLCEHCRINLINHGKIKIKFY